MLGNLFLGILFLIAVCMICFSVWVIATAIEAFEWLDNNELVGSLDIDEADVELFNRDERGMR